MNKFFIKSIFALFLIFSISSCTETVDVDVPNGGDRLVVDALIAWEKGTTGQHQSIRLTTSTEYFASDLDVPVVGASVIITNNNTGEDFILNDQNDGNYSTTNFIPIINDSYTLEIMYNGQTYLATETLLSVSNITNIEQEVITSGDENETHVIVYFDDPANVANFYLAEFIPSHKPLLDLEPLNDEFSDGNQNFLEYDDDELVAGDMISINLYGISQEYYNYIDLLTSQVGENGPFQVTPARLKGNCRNINDPNEEVLGYFRLNEVDRTSFTIE